MRLVCKSFTIQELERYVESIKFNGWTPNFVVVHNTSVPNQKLYNEWHSRPNWTMEQWGKNLASYYTGLGWNGCPHLFVGYDNILVLNDLAYPGTHTPSWNKISWGVETIAEFDNEPFNGTLRSNLVSALSILHTRIGLNPSDFKLGVRGLHFHKEDKNTTHKNCPGKNLKKDELIKLVVEEMNKYAGEHIDVPKTVHETITDGISDYLTDYELLDVKWLQQNLNAKCNAGLKVDGIIGPATKLAVKNFQKIAWVSPIDGIAGPITRKALKNYKREIQL